MTPPTPKTRAEQRLDAAVEGCVEDCAAAFARLYRRAGVVVPHAHTRSLAAALEPLYRELVDRAVECFNAAAADDADTSETLAIH
jgi:hypothetical protein